MTTANIATAKNELSRLLRRVKRGERVVITERNRPIAHLQPFTAEGSGKMGSELAALYDSGVLTSPATSDFNVAAFLAMPSAVLLADQSLTTAVLAEREEGR